MGSVNVDRWASLVSMLLEIGENTESHVTVECPDDRVCNMCDAICMPCRWLRLIAWWSYADTQSSLDQESSELCLSQCKHSWSTFAKAQRERRERQRCALFVAMHSAHLCRHNSSGCWTAPANGNERWEKRSTLAVPKRVCRHKRQADLSFPVGPLPSKRDRPKVQTPSTLNNTGRQAKSA